MLTKKICIALFFVICVFINLGCSSRLNKIYEYKPASFAFEGGEIGAKLIGTFNAQKGLTIKGSPYELLIWYETALQVNDHVAVISLELRDSDNNTVIKKIESMKKEFEQRNDDKYVAYFSIKDLELEYIQYNLAIEIRVKKDRTVVNETVNLNFKKDYKEYRSNDFWDRITSV